MNPKLYALLAQLDRVCGYEPQGQGFESLTARHQTAQLSGYIENIWKVCIICKER